MTGFFTISELRRGECDDCGGTLEKARVLRSCAVRHAAYLEAERNGTVEQQAQGGA